MLERTDIVTAGAFGLVLYQFVEEIYSNSQYLSKWELVFVVAS